MRWATLATLQGSRAPLLLAAAYLAATFLAGHRVPVVFPFAVLVFVPVVVLFEVTRLRWRLRSKRRPGGPVPDREAWRLVGHELRRGVLSPRRLVPALAVLVALALFMDAFIAWKQAIPRYTSYGWDPALAELDRALHLGVDPWRITHALFGSAFATRVIDFVYVSWYTALAAFVLAVAFAPPSGRRTRVLVTYLMVWVVLGTAMATFFASGGPVYYEHFTGDATFEPLLARLAPLDLRATDLQQALLAGFTGERGFLAEGINAMPSVHVGVAVLFALVLWPCGSWPRGLSIAYAALIQLGSVHLGWHYAVDGYVAAAVTAGLWFALAWVERRGSQRQPDPGRRADQPRQNGGNLAAPEPGEGGVG